MVKSCGCLLLINSKICERMQTNSGDLPINTIGTSEEIIAQSHGDTGDPIMLSFYKM